MILGLQVIQSSGEKMTPGLAFLRWVGYLFSGLILNLGFLWIVFDKRKQGWHDKIAGTLVIYRPEEPLSPEADQKMP
ncbi:MAG: RDD family protein, partial [Methanoregula sp.]|nr:RDD family protein [Methanoregula sp.]